MNPTTCDWCNQPATWTLTASYYHSPAPHPLHAAYPAPQARCCNQHLTNHLDKDTSTDGSTNQWIIQTVAHTPEPLSQFGDLDDTEWAPTTPRIVAYLRTVLAECLWNRQHLDNNPAFDITADHGHTYCMWLGATIRTFENQTNTP